MVNAITPLFRVLNIFRIMIKNGGNVNKNNGKRSIATKELTKLKILKRNRSRKMQLKKYILIHIQLLTGFLIIPLTSLYDEYIDRPKLSEQKKNPVEGIVSPPTKMGSEQ